jgi:hypothetical protein
MLQSSLCSQVVEFCPAIERTGKVIRAYSVLRIVTVSLPRPERSKFRSDSLHKETELYRVYWKQILHIKPIRFKTLTECKQILKLYKVQAT